MSGGASTSLLTCPLVLELGGWGRGGGRERKPHNVTILNWCQGEELWRRDGGRAQNKLRPPPPSLQWNGCGGRKRES